jgi:hypothetical protein
MGLKIIEHTSGRAISGLRAINAIIETTGPVDNKELVAYYTAIKLGRHPHGYGMYGPYRVEPTGVPNQYSVAFESGNNCN